MARYAGATVFARSPLTMPPPSLASAATVGENRPTMTSETPALSRPIDLKTVFGGARAVITGGRVLAVTERVAAGGQWRSNIAGGAAQHRVEPRAVSQTVSQ